MYKKFAREKNTQTGVSFDYIPNHKFYLWRVKIESVHSKKNKSSFDIMEEATSTVKNQRRTNKWTKVVYNTQGGSVNIM